MAESIQNPPEESTREKIKAAATEEFIHKGFDGARMQAIADRAGANKAMIYYYFRSKEALFEAVLRETFEELVTRFAEIRPEGDPDPRVLIPQIVRLHFRFLAEHPAIPKILLREMHSNHPIVPKVLGEIFGRIRSERYPDFVRIFEAGIRSGKIRDVDPLQTILNIISMNAFYFIARPVLSVGWPDVFASVPEEKLLEMRERAVSDLVLNGLLPRQGD
ncbi:MAG: TetR/AcrR family transcriptional regulator [bacterium]|nr:TetR/AcrR family transcriptional regulator [bacterium]